MFSTVRGTAPWLVFICPRDGHWGTRARPLPAYGLACLEYLEFVAAGEAFPVAWDEACERSCCCGCLKPVLRSAARDEFGEVPGDEGVSCAYGVYSVYR